MAKGAPPPDGMVVCHSCDNPPCCNPDHLFLGTQAENLDDMTHKGRRVAGERDGAAKLTESAVVAIRALDGLALQRDIAAAFGVSKQAVSKIVRGSRWAHVPTAPSATADRRGSRFDRVSSG